MKINYNRLLAESNTEKIVHETTKNKEGIINPEFIIIHFTAGSSTESSVEWFKNPSAGASAHLVIGKDGKIVQLIDFNKKAWHAGTSQWADKTGFNNFSIGIELDNPGRLHKSGDKYYSWFGTEYPSTAVVKRVHKHEDEPSYWMAYTEQQINACLEVCKLLMGKYRIKDILGHDDIAPFRKNDPGPMFPMESFRAKLLGRQDEIGDIFKTTVDKVNIRKGPSRETDSIIKLDINTEVAFIKSENGWFYVFVADKPSKINDVVYGWIHNSLLTK